MAAYCHAHFRIQVPGARHRDRAGLRDGNFSLTLHPLPLGEGIGELRGGNFSATLPTRGR